MMGYGIRVAGGWDNEEGDVAWSMPKASADELIRYDCSATYRSKINSERC